MFINEIIYYHPISCPSMNKLQPRHDYILYYGFNYMFNMLYTPYKVFDKRNKNYNRGKHMEDIWNDIAAPSQLHEARLYPTKKSSRLMERIICLSTV